MHPILSVLISRPELILEHVSGYAMLVRDEASSVGAEVARRAVAWGVAAVAALLFLILAGVAAMLGAVQQNFHWALVVVPGLALAAAVAAFLAARKPLPERAFRELKAQLDADAQALRAVGVRS